MADKKAGLAWIKSLGLYTDAGLPSAPASTGTTPDPPATRLVLDYRPCPARSWRVWLAASAVADRGDSRQGVFSAPDDVPKFSTMLISVLRFVRSANA